MYAACSQSNDPRHLHLPLTEPARTTIDLLFRIAKTDQHSIMAIDSLISDPTLRPLLETSQATLAQTASVLAWLQQQPAGHEPSLEQKLELSQQQKILNAYLAKLRGQSRRAAFGARATKQETAEARQEVDRLLLQLQNLYYEQRHLMGEIGACEGYEYELDL